MYRMKAPVTCPSSRPCVTLLVHAETVSFLVLILPWFHMHNRIDMSVQELHLDAPFS